MRSYVFKRKRQKNGRSVADRTWSGAYRLDGDSAETRVPLGVTDKRVAEQRLAQIVKDAEFERAGLSVPRSLLDAASLPLLDHLRDYVTDLRKRNRDKRYVGEVSYRIRGMMKACSWKYPRDVTFNGFMAWRDRQDKSAKTLNDYFNAISGLIRWMIDSRRLKENPLLGMKLVDTRGRETFERRALVPAEFDRLLQSCGRRRPLYLAAVYTALRRGALYHLRWSDVHLDALHPFVLVRALTQKDRKPRTIPLHEDLVAELRTLKPNDAAGSDRVFAGMLPRVGLNWYREDLRRADIADRDGKGRRVDFHALRHTACTWGGSTGIAGPTFQGFTGHASAKQAARYTHAEMLPTAGLIDLLPRFGTLKVGATGTDGKPSIQWTDGGTDGGTISADATGPGMSQAGTITSRGEHAEVLRNSGKTHDLTRSVTTGHNEQKTGPYRIRTCDIRCVKATL